MAKTFSQQQAELQQALNQLKKQQDIADAKFIKEMGTELLAQLRHYDPTFQTVDWKEMDYNLCKKNFAIMLAHYEDDKHLTNGLINRVEDQIEKRHHPKKKPSPAEHEPDEEEQSRTETLKKNVDSMGYAVKNKVANQSYGRFREE